VSNATAPRGLFATGDKDKWIVPPAGILSSANEEIIGAGKVVAAGSPFVSAGSDDGPTFREIYYNEQANIIAEEGITDIDFLIFPGKYALKKVYDEYKRIAGLGRADATYGDISFMAGVHLEQRNLNDVFPTFNITNPSFTGDVSANLFEKCLIYPGTIAPGQVPDVNHQIVPVQTNILANYNLSTSYLAFERFCKNPFNDTLPGHAVGPHPGPDAPISMDDINSRLKLLEAIYSLWHFDPSDGKDFQDTEVADNAFWKQQKYWLYIPMPQRVNQNLFCELNIPATSAQILAAINQRQSKLTELKFYSDNVLKYIEYDSTTKSPKIETIENDNIQYLKAIGRLRFDTVLVRNILWITNIQRLIHAVLRSDFAPFKHPLSNDLSILSPLITEKNFRDNISN